MSPNRAQVKPFEVGGKLWALLWMCLGLEARTELVTLLPVVLDSPDGTRIEYRSEGRLVFRSTEEAPVGVQLKLPGRDWVPVRFPSPSRRDSTLQFGPVRVGDLTLGWRLVQRTPSLIEQTLEVRAGTAQRFAAAFPLDVVIHGEFASFSGVQTVRAVFDTVRGAPKLETFPVVMVRGENQVFGLAADSPGLWSAVALHRFWGIPRTTHLQMSATRISARDQRRAIFLPGIDGNFPSRLPETALR